METKPSNRTSKESSTSETKSSSSRTRNKSTKSRGKTPSSKSSKGRRRHKTRRISVSPWIIFAAVAVAIAVFIIVPVRNNYIRQLNIERGASVPPKIKGEYVIDISHHNDAVNACWDSLMVMTDSKGRTVNDISVAKDVHKVTGVIIKATEGLNMKDKLFSSYWKELSPTELKRGAYHFFRSSKSGAIQARHYIRVTGDLRHTDFPPILDVETIHKGCSKLQLNKEIKKWLEIVQKHYGRTPIIYTYDSFAQDFIDKDILSSYPIWIAHYNVDKPILENWDMWQFTDNAIVYGFPGPVDLSIVKTDKKK